MRQCNGGLPWLPVADREDGRERMKQKLFQIALLVRDYDEAIEFFTHALGFQLLQDTKLDVEPVSGSARELQTLHLTEKNTR